MKFTIDVDKLVTKATELGIKGYDKAKAATPAAKVKALSFKDRMKEAVATGKEAARR